MSLRAVLFDVDFTIARPGPELGPEGYRRLGERFGLELDFVVAEYFNFGAGRVLKPRDLLYIREHANGRRSHFLIGQEYRSIFLQDATRDWV